MMTSFPFTTTIRHILPKVKDENTKSYFSITKSNSEHLPNKTSSVSGLYTCGTSNAPVLISKTNYYVPGTSTNHSSYSPPEKKVEEIVIIDSSDDSDSETSNTLSVSKRNKVDVPSEMLAEPKHSRDSTGQPAIVFNTEQCRNYVSYNRNTSTNNHEKKLEDIIVIDSSDDGSDLEVKQDRQQSGKVKSSVGTHVKRNKCPSDSGNVDEQSISFSVKGGCNIMMTVSQPVVKLNQNLNLQKSSAKFSTIDNISQSRETSFSDGRSFVSTCASKCETSAVRNNSSAVENLPHHVFKKLNKVERSCTFCGRSFGTASGLKEHNRFHCQFQKKCELLCKICGLKFNHTFNARQHIRKNHMVKKKHAVKLKDYVVLKLPGNTLSDDISLQEINNSGTLCSSKQQTSSTASSDGKQRNLNQDTDNKVKLLLNAKEGVKRQRHNVNNTKKVQCKFCMHIFRNSSYLQTHLNYSCRYHRKYELVCKICGNRYSAKGGLYYHIVNKHGIKNVKQHSFRVKINKLTENNKNFDISRKRFKCNNCFRSFVENRYLGTHLRYCRSKKNNISTTLKIKSNTHKILSGKCGVCNMSFVHPDDIENHCILSHNKIKIICQKCGMVFDCLMEFKCHLTIHNRYYVSESSEKLHQEPTQNGQGNTDASDSVNDDESQKNSYSCNVCNEIFLSVTLLMEHLQAHLI